MKKEDVSKSWFCVFNNPEKHGYEGTPAEIVSEVIAKWIEDNPQRTCAVTYCISADGLKHLHAVFEDVRAMRFTKIKKVFPSMHIEATKGNKEQAEKYINKQPPFDEMGEQVIYTSRHGEIKGRQGQRRDLDILEELINQDLTPVEIMDMSMSYRKHEKLIRDAYYRKRSKETPVLRDINVIWHWGESGSGKSYTYVKKVEEHGEEHVYLVGEYERGFDKYNGEKILFLDEFRGQIKYEQLLALLSGYKVQTYARYSNVVGLWDEVHITSVFPPDLLYENMITNHRKVDSYEQLRRRITNITYHYKTNDGDYIEYNTPSDEYENYNKQKRLAKPEYNNAVFTEVKDDDTMPF
ncbi:MAG: hypothetical protein FWC16_03435 [Defluviitaleaceae bacterium]|nr:hypothetical protein [Defluviitaleaceae bacterium]MCL2273955.1 hypothetical protein [Defluviitaleaceae bacterium]